MSLFDFVDGKKKQPEDGKTSASTKPPAKKAPVKKPKTPPKREVEAGDVTTGDVVDAPGIEAQAPRGSVLKDAGFVMYSLACEKCKFKKDVKITGEPKPHHLLCKKCGASMKVTRKR